MANRKVRRQQGNGIAAVLIPCVICKPAEEIEKATGKEEQFRVVKGRVIEKNLPSLSPFDFAASVKGNFLAGVLPSSPAKWKRTVLLFVFRRRRSCSLALMAESELVSAGRVSQSLRAADEKQSEIRVQLTAICKQEGQVIKSQFIFSLP